MDFAASMYTCWLATMAMYSLIPQTLHGVDTNFQLLQLQQINDRSICKAISKAMVAILDAVMDVSFICLPG